MLIIVEDDGFSEEILGVFESELSFEELKKEFMGLKKVRLFKSDTYSSLLYDYSKGKHIKPEEFNLGEIVTLSHIDPDLVIPYNKTYTVVEVGMEEVGGYFDMEKFVDFLRNHSQVKEHKEYMFV